MAADIGITLSFDGYKQFIGQLTAIQDGLLDVSDIIKISAKELDAYENELKKIQPDLDFDTLFGDLKNISTGLADFVKSFKGMDEINAEGARTAIGTLIQLVNDLDQGLQERGDVNLLVDDLNKLGPAIRAFGDALGFFGRSTIIKNIGTNATQIVLALNSIAAGLKVKDFLDTLVPYEKALADLAVTIKGLIALGGKGALKGLIAVDLEQERQKTIDARKAHTELKEELREESDARKANKKAISEQEKELAKLSARQQELDSDYFTNEILESTRVLDRFIGSIFDTREAIDKLKPSLEIKIKVAGIKAFSSLISLITTGPIKLLGFMAKSFAQIAVAMGKIGFNVFIKGFKILLSLLSKGIQLVGKFALMLGKLAVAIVKIPVKILGNALKAIMSVIKGVIHVVASLVLGLARLLVWSVKLVAKITLLTALFKVLMLPVKILTGAINALTGAVTRLTSNIRGSELDKTTQDMKELGAASTQTADAQNKLQVELSQTDKELQETQAGALKTQNALQGMNLVASGVNLAKTFATGRALTNTIKNVIGFTLAFKALQKATQAVSFAFQQVRFHLTNMVKEAFASAAAYEDLTLSLTALVTLEFKDFGLYTPDTTTDLEQKLKVGIDTQSFAEAEKAMQDLTKFDEEDLTLRFTTEGPEDNTNIIEYYLALNEADAAQERAAMSADGLRDELKSLSQTTKDVVSSTANDFSASLQSLNQTAQQVANSGANTFSNMLNDLRELGNTAVSPKFDTQGAETFANATDMVNERVQELLRWVRTLAIQSPFQEKDVAELLRYAQAMGFTSQQAQDLTQNVVDFGAAMKATPDQMKSVIRAFGQMRNASNLTKEDLNQLSEAGFRNPLQALADELEISVPEVLQAITDKAIDGEKAVAIFSRRMVADFAGSALKATKSLSGLASTMSSLRQNIMREFATPVFEVFKPLIAAFTGTDEINNMLKSANELGKVFAEKVEAAMMRLIKVAGTLKGIFDSIPKPVLKMIKGFAKFAAIATSVVIALTLLKTAVAATVITLGILVNPLSLAVGILTAFGVTIVSVAKKVGTHLNALGTQFQAFGAALAPAITVAQTIFDRVLTSISNMLSGFVNTVATYGRNIGISFANGIVASVGYVIDAVNALAGAISFWLSPGSPPKALPDIDQWGTDAANEFLGGFSDADFDLIEDYADTLQDLVGAIGLEPGDFDFDDLTLDFANLVASLNDVEVSDDAAIFEFYSELSRETGEAIVDIKNFADEYIHLAKEQSVLNSLTVEYEENLKKSNTQLDKLSREEAFADQSKELDNLNKALNNKYLTAEAKEKLELKRRRVLAELQKNEVDEQGAVVDAQQEQIALMKKRLGLSGKFGDDPAAAGGDAAGAMASKLGKLKVDDIAEEFADLTEGIDGTISTATNLSEALENMEIPELNIGKIFGDAQGQIQEKIKGLTARFEELGISMTTVKRVAIALGAALVAPTLFKTIITLGSNLGVLAKVLARVGLVASIGLAPVIAIGAGLVLFADKLTPELFKSLGDSFKSFGDGLSSFFTSYQSGLGGAEGMSLGDMLKSMTEFSPEDFGKALGASLVSVRDTITENIKTYITDPFNKAFAQGDFYFDNRTLSERLRDGISAVFTGIAESVKETVSNFVINNIITPFMEGFSTDGLSYETFGQQIFDGLKAVFAPLGQRLETFINETFNIDIDDITEPLVENFTNAFNNIDLAIDGASFGEKMVAGLKAAFASKEINIAELFTFKIPETSPFAEFFAAFGNIKDALPVEVLQLFSFWWERFRENIETTGLGAKLEVLAANFFTLAKYVGIVVGAIAGLVGIVAGSIFVELPALLGGVIDALSGIIGIVTSIVDIFIAVFTGGDVIQAFKDLFGSFKLFQTGIDGIATSIFNALANIVVSIFKLFNIPVTEEALKMIRKVSTVFGAVLGQILVGLLLWQGKIFNIFGKVVQFFAKFGLNFGKIGVIVAKTFTAIGKTLTTAFTKILKVVTPAAKKVGQKIVTGIFGVLRNLGSRLVSLLSKAFGKIGSTDLTKSFLNQFVKLGGKIKSLIDDVVKAIVGKFKKPQGDLSEPIESAFSKLKTNLIVIFDDIVAAISERFTLIKGSATTIFNNLVDELALIFNNLKTRLPEVFDEIVTAISAKIDTFKTAIITKFDDLAPTLGVKFTAIKTKFLAVFDDITTGIGPKLEALKTKMVTKAGELGTAFKAELDKILPKIATILDEAGTKIATALDEAGIKIKTTIKEAFSGLFSGTNAEGEATSGIFSGLVDSATAAKASLVLLFDAPIFETVFTNVTELITVFDNISLKDPLTIIHASVELMLLVPQTIFDLFNQILTFFTGYTLPNPFQVIQDAVGAIPAAIDALQERLNLFSGFFDSLDFGGKFEGIGDTVNSFFSRGEKPDTSGFTDGVAEGVVADLDASFSEADVKFDASNITVDEESFKAVGALGGENVKDGVLIGLEGEDVETDNVIANMGENIKGAWANFWDTNSPSEVAKEDMGKPIGEGILIGIKEALSGQDATEGLETDAGGGFLSSVLTVNPESITAFSTTFSTLFEGVQQLLTDFIADFMDEMEDFLDDLIKFLDDEFKDIIQLVKDTFDTIIEKLNAFAIDVLLILNTLMANIKTVMDKFKTIMENAAKAGIQAFLDQLDGFGDAVKTKLEAELAFLNDDGEGSLREFMKEAGVELGDAVMKGIIAGIQTATPATVTAAANAVDSVVAAMQNAAGIASPSKVTMDNVGKPLIDGVKLGMFNATGGLLDQAGSSIKSAIDSAKVQISSASIDALRIPVTDDYMQSVMQQQSLPDSSKIATMQTASNKSVVNNTNYTMNMTVKESQATRVNRNFSKMKALRAV